MSVDLKCLTINEAPDNIPVSMIDRSHINDVEKLLKKHEKKWFLSNKSIFETTGLLMIPCFETGGISRILWVENLKYDNPLLSWAKLADSLPNNHTYKLDPNFDVPFLGALGWVLSINQSLQINLDSINQNYFEKDIGSKKLVVNRNFDLPLLSFMAKSLLMARQLINLPAENINPKTFPEFIESSLKPFKSQAKFRKICDKELETNYPAIYTVGKGARDKPCLVHFTWHPKKSKETLLKKIALVGKGVTFDTGGLNIKPDRAMLLMKKDMGGAASVLALANLVMNMNLPVELSVFIPIVENAISDRAMRPLDITKTRSGLNVEIGHTDAEGRVILADALYAACEDKPDLIIDFATLTGAARIALGTDLPAVFSNSYDIAQTLVKLGQELHDPVWHMPLHKPYEDDLKTPRADLTNSPSNPYAGAITAALFLQKFINEYAKNNQTLPPHWVHIDTMGYNLKSLPGKPEGGEALGLRTVYDFIKQFIYVPK